MLWSVEIPVHNSRPRKRGQTILLPPEVEAVFEATGPHRMAGPEAVRPMDVEQAVLPPEVVPAASLPTGPLLVWPAFRLTVFLPERQAAVAVLARRREVLRLLCRPAKPDARLGLAATRRSALVAFQCCQQQGEPRDQRMPADLVGQPPGQLEPIWMYLPETPEH